MNSQLTKDQLIGEFEVIWENDVKIDKLNEQIKVIKQDSKERFEDFTKENEIKSVSFVKEAYKRWRKLKISGEAPDQDEDFYTLLVMVDEAITEDSDSGDSK